MLFESHLWVLRVQGEKCENVVTPTQCIQLVSNSAPHVERCFSRTRAQTTVSIHIEDFWSRQCGMGPMVRGAHRQQCNDGLHTLERGLCEVAERAHAWAKLTLWGRLVSLESLCCGASANEIQLHEDSLASAAYCHRGLMCCPRKVRAGGLTICRAARLAWRFRRIMPSSWPWLCHAKVGQSSFASVVCLDCSICARGLKAREVVFTRRARTRMRIFFWENCIAHIN